MNKVFKDHPSLKKYHETADGTKFYDEDAAKTHARSLDNRKVKTVYRSEAKAETKEEPVVTKPKVAKVKKEMIVKTVTAETAQTEDTKDAEVDSKDLTPMAAAKLRVEAIDKLNSIEEVEKALKDETAGSVKKAGTKRIAALKASKALDSKTEKDNVQTS